MYMHSFNIIVGAIGVISTIIIFCALLINCYAKRKHPVSIPSNDKTTAIYRWRKLLLYLSSGSLVHEVFDAWSVSFHFHIIRR